MRKFLLTQTSARWFITAMIFTVAGLGCLTSRYATADDSPPPTPAEEQPEVLTRGPVHESYAAPVDTQPAAPDSMLAPSEPPANVDETPPDEKPEGGNVAWVPGYWSWDADRSGYVWVSGCWRAAPPQMTWVPGYWAHVGGGWNWVAGYWAPVGHVQAEYLPAPPEIAVEAETPGDPPSADVIWVPPCNYWSGGRYTLRRGYWLRAQPGWVWSPSHLIWTPRGYLFVAGHWDYEFSRRGVLFAPVFFTPGVRVHVYSPSIVVSLDVVKLNFFAYPRYHHYFFGDYYDASYVTIGIHPWYEVSRNHRWYGPECEYDRWDNRRRDPHWEDHVRHDYDDRRDHPDHRPARTYREMETRVAHAPEAQRRNMEMARPLSKVVVSKTTTVKFQRIDNNERRHIAEQSKNDDKRFRDERERAPVQKVSQPSNDHRGNDKNNDKGNDRNNDRGNDRNKDEPASSKDRGGKVGANDRVKDNTPGPSDRHDSATPSDRRNSDTPASSNDKKKDSGRSADNAKDKTPPAQSPDHRAGDDQKSSPPPSSDNKKDKDQSDKEKPSNDQPAGDDSRHSDSGSKGSRSGDSGKDSRSGDSGKDPHSGDAKDSHDSGSKKGGGDSKGSHNDDDNSDSSRKDDARNKTIKSGF